MLVIMKERESSQVKKWTVGETKVAGKRGKKRGIMGVYGVINVYKCNKRVVGQT